MNLGTIPWIVIFAGTAAVGMWRSWGWVVVLSLFCMGVTAANTEIGQSVVGLVTNVIAGIGSAVRDALGALVA